jgi:hypothetical protein
MEIVSMHAQFEAELDAHLTAARIAALVSVHRDGYGKVVLHNSPEDGWDAQMFGFAVYKYIVKRLRNLTRDPQLGFELRSAAPAFRMGAGPFTLAPYCCGHSGDEDINESFPKNENGAPSLVDVNQYDLDLNDATQSVPRALVLAHFGNPTNGLEALYAAVPSSKRDNKIDGWNYTKLLWRRESGEMSGPPSPPDLPRPAVVGPAPLSLKGSLGKRAGESASD